MAVNIPVKRQDIDLVGFPAIQDLPSGSRATAFVFSSEIVHARDQMMMITTTSPYRLSWYNWDATARKFVKDQYVALGVVPSAPASFGFGDAVYRDSYLNLVFIGSTNGVWSGTTITSIPYGARTYTNQYNQQARDNLVSSGAHMVNAGLAVSWVNAASNPDGTLNISAGEIHTYVKSGGSWSETSQILQSPAPTSNGFFGAQVVSTYGNTAGIPEGILVGEQGRGLIHFYQWNSGTNTWVWQWQKAIDASKAGATNFGVSIILAGDALMVGYYPAGATSSTSASSITGASIYKWNTGTAAWDYQASYTTVPFYSGSGYSWSGSGNTDWQFDGLKLGLRSAVGKAYRDGYAFWSRPTTADAFTSLNNYSNCMSSSTLPPRVYFSPYQYFRHYFDEIKKVFFPPDTDVSRFDAILVDTTIGFDPSNRKNYTGAMSFSRIGNADRIADYYVDQDKSWCEDLTGYGLYAKPALHNAQVPADNVHWVSPTKAIVGVSQWRFGPNGDDYSGYTGAPFVLDMDSNGLMKLSYQNEVGYKRAPWTADYKAAYDPVRDLYYVSPGVAFKPVTNQEETEFILALDTGGYAYVCKPPYSFWPENDLLIGKPYSTDLATYGSCFKYNATNGKHDTKCPGQPIPAHYDTTDQFGAYSRVINGRLYIAAPYRDWDEFMVTSVANAGAVYEFTYNPATDSFTETGYLTAAEPRVANSYFGLRMDGDEHSMAVSAVAGTSETYANDSISVFKRVDGVTTRAASFTCPPSLQRASTERHLWGRDFVYRRGWLVVMSLGQSPAIPVVYDVLRVRDGGVVPYRQYVSTTETDTVANAYSAPFPSKGMEGVFRQDADGKDLNGMVIIGNPGSSTTTATLREAVQLDVTLAEPHNSFMAF